MIKYINKPSTQLDINGFDIYQNDSGESILEYCGKETNDQWLLIAIADLESEVIQIADSLLN